MSLRYEDASDAEVPSHLVVVERVSDDQCRCGVEVEVAQQDLPDLSFGMAVKVVHAKDPVEVLGDSELGKHVFQDVLLGCRKNGLAEAGVAEVFKDLSGIEVQTDRGVGEKTVVKVSSHFVPVFVFKPKADVSIKIFDGKAKHISIVRNVDLR